MELLIVWIIGGILAGVIASSKGRNALGWVLLAVLLTPLAVLVLLVLPNLKEQRAAAAAAADNKKCPKCAEAVKREALVCRFCGHEFAVSGVPQAGPSRVEVSPPTSERRSGSQP